MTPPDTAALPPVTFDPWDNAEGNGWPTLCLTRCGNWQPVEDGDTVVAEVVNV